MAGFEKIFKKTCGALLEGRGFKCFKFDPRFKELTYYKVVNDVLHSFYYELLPKTWAKRCRVYFGVTPLCSIIKRYEAPLKEKGISVSHPFCLKEYVGLDECFYYTPTDESINACMSEIAEYMTKYMFPFFDMTDSCKTALSESIKTEKFLIDIKATNYKLKYEEEPEKMLVSKFWLNKDAIYYMALKSEEYVYAIKHEKAILSIYNDKIKRAYNNILRLSAIIEKKEKEPEKPRNVKNVFYGYGMDLKRRDIEREQDFIDRIKSEMRQIEENIARLESRDTEYFNNMLMENEVRSREVLKELKLI